MFETNFDGPIVDFMNSNRNYIHQMKETKRTKMKWKDLVLMKDPLSLTIYLQLIQDLKPKTIIEFGTFEGGSALWMADMCRVLGIDCGVYTFDNVPERVKLKETDGVIFNPLDVKLINRFVEFNLKPFKELPRPMIVIEDCHVNVTEICNCMDRVMDVGDYLIIEDTLDKSKHDIMVSFLVNNCKYDIDRHYCDFWGRNNTWNINSFLKKVKT